MEPVPDDMSQCNHGASPQAPTSPISRDSNVHWLPYSLPFRNYLFLSVNNIEMRNNLRAEKVAFWNNLIPKLKGEPSLGVYKTPMVGAVMGYDTPEVNLWVFITITGVLLALVLLLTVLFVKSSLRHQRFQRSLQVYEGSNNISPTRV